ncbi:hypothetical protein [Streptomyces sp. NPDC049813]|uniref:hypothetical protein n=1 Tax=Streptomyces sp. NPDC049813 TaxID=3365597 RepID=UPI003791F54F
MHRALTPTALALTATLATALTAPTTVAAPAPAADRATLTKASAPAARAVPAPTARAVLAPAAHAVPAPAAHAVLAPAARAVLTSAAPAPAASAVLASAVPAAPAGPKPMASTGPAALAAPASTAPASAALAGPTGAVTPAPAGRAVPRVGEPPEADLAYHGHATLRGTRVTVVLTPQNHGPHDVSDATLLLTLTSPLADVQALPAGCLRAGPRAVSCRTGALPAATYGRRFTVPVQLAAASTEVTVEVTTAWSGGPSDRNHGNDRLRFLVLDTGDTYYF